MKVMEYILSAWVFFFRFPAISLKNYYPSSIVIGGFLQGIVFYLFYLTYEHLLLGGQALYFITPSFLALISLSFFTGFFHEDGLSDIFDSFGVSRFDQSKENTDRIKKAMIDSRLGSFGVHIAIILWFFRFNISQTSPLLISIIILYSRTFGIFMGILESRNWLQSDESKLSKYLYEIPQKQIFIALLSCLFIFFYTVHFHLFPIKIDHLLFLLIGIPLFHFFLIKIIAKRSGFLNGDIVGGCILINEIILGIYLTKVLITS